MECQAEAAALLPSFRELTSAGVVGRDRHGSPSDGSTDGTSSQQSQVPFFIFFILLSLFSWYFFIFLLLLLLSLILFVRVAFCTPWWIGQLIADWPINNCGSIQSPWESMMMIFRYSCRQLRRRIRQRSRLKSKSSACPRLTLCSSSHSRSAHWWDSIHSQLQHWKWSILNDFIHGTETGFDARYDRPWNSTHLPTERRRDSSPDAGPFGGFTTWFLYCLSYAFH